MIPSTLVFRATQTLLAADATTLAPATDANIVKLVTSSFVPSQSLDLGSLTFASFTGSTPKAAGTGAQPVFRDPVTNQRVIQVKEPVGGWTWTCTADPTVPETVYGVVLTNDDGTVLLGSQLLASAVTIAKSGDGLNVDKLWFAFSNDSPA